LLIGQQATWRGERLAKTVETFTTTADLKERVAKLASPEIGAVFHAAAVNDFGFGKVFQRSADRELKEIKADKIPTRMDSLLVELVATPKIIGKLRDYFPNANIVGWKYEMDGTRAEVIAKALAQIRANKTDACVANGAAYGAGFGIVKSADESAHYLGPAELFEGLSKLLQK
jgi:phosphopantothenoylcysteine synthetase/decarboxylase